MEIILNNNVKYKFYRSINFLFLILCGIVLLISAILSWFWIIRLMEVLIFVICMFTFFNLKKEISKIVANKNILQLFYDKTIQTIYITEVDVYVDQLILYSANKNIILIKKHWSNTELFEEMITKITEIKININKTKKKKDIDFIIDIVDDVVN